MIVLDGADIWKLHATHGLPLEMSIPMLADRGYVPAWDRLIEAAKRDGANIARLFDRLDGAIGDAYSLEDASEIRRRMSYLKAYMA